VKLTFLGTRGYIEEKSRLHRRHASVLVGYRHSHLLIDYGTDWIGRDATITPRPQALLITHAHPDHAGGLAQTVPWPVWATRDTWNALDAQTGTAHQQRHVFRADDSFTVGQIRATAYRVAHSTRAPAVGFRLEAGRAAICYVPDVVYIPDRERALGGTDLYVGDGTSLERSLVRRVKGRLIGHIPIRAQLTWCAKEGVPRAIFTHLGADIVGGDERVLKAKLRRMARAREVDAGLARDGQEIVIRSG
jgi:phosphoribosyl 1,2-cyclic phosphodiesterase